jgi:hypothetical protein
LTLALAKNADLAEIAAIDYSPVFVEELLSRRLTIAACKDRPFRPQRDGGAAGTNADQSVPTEAWTGMSPESDDDHLH